MSKTKNILQKIEAKSNRISHPQERSRFFARKKNMCYYKDTKIKTNTTMKVEKNTLPEDILGSIEIPVESEVPTIWEETLKEKLEQRSQEFSQENDTDVVYPLSLEEFSETSTTSEEISPNQEIVMLGIVERSDTVKIEEEQKSEFQSDIVYEKKSHTILNSIKFLLKYATTSGIIFALLLFTTNFQAYYAIGYSIVFKQKMIQKQEGLLNSVEAGNIVNEDTQLNSAEEEYIVEERNFHSLENFVAKSQNQNVNLDITITPYENRIVIPKIGKNIPLLDVKEPKVSGLDELNDIFMKELESGVVRYPGSAKPGNPGNAFIFGHSSNFPWLEGEYNDVFALLDNVVYGDEIVVYYGQEKYTYKIYEKRVIKPGDVSVLKKNTDISEITLMTCWPIGTDLNRLVVIGELVTDQ